MLSWLPTNDHGKEDNKDVTILPPELIQTTSDDPLSGRISIPAITKVWWGILCLYHNHSSAGHPG
jgi:hypothetical protein